MAANPPRPVSRVACEVHPPQFHSSPLTLGPFSHPAGMSSSTSCTIAGRLSASKRCAHHHRRLVFVISTTGDAFADWIWRASQGGRIESILMSLPLSARWEYDQVRLHNLSSQVQAGHGVSPFEWSVSHADCYRAHRVRAETGGGKRRGQGDGVLQKPARLAVDVGLIDGRALNPSPLSFTLQTACRVAP